jgi:AraC-like DNA-binding protein
MLHEIINQTLFFEGCMAVLLAIVQFLQAFRDRKHVWPCILFSGAAFIVLQQFYIGAYSKPDLELALWPGQFVKFLLGPAILFSYRKLIYRNYVMVFRDLAHLLPAVIAVVIEAFVDLSPLSQSTAVLDLREAITGNKIDYYYNVFGVLLFSLYLFYVPVREGLVSFNRRKNNDTITKVILIFIVFVGIVITLMMFAILAHRVMLARFIGSFSILAFIAIFIATYQFPQTMPILTSMIRKKLYERSLIKGFDIEALKNRLRDIIEEEKVFCDEDLTLKRLADMLSISPHRLSEFLNKHLSVNFNNYINRLRVEEAVSLMRSQPERSISSICYSVGFNSRSVFYRAFTDIMGVSPAKFKKNPTL